VADVQPFRGLRYNPERIGDLSAVISPPYDVISAEEQLLYHRKSPYNVIRLEFGEERAEDSGQNDKYTRAALNLKNWLKDGILIREGSPAFYLVEHRFRYQGPAKSRFSLIARVRLEDFSSGQIRPHEMTLRRPSADRIRLLQSCRANLSPIMGLYRHHGEGILSLLPDTIDKPALTAVDNHGITYSMWVITDEEAIARVCRFFTEKVLYIADGHNRYEAALAYQQEQRSARPSGKEAFNFVMMALTDSEDPNLIMLPTHRLVRGLDAKTLEKLERESDLYFRKELLAPLANKEETLRSWLDILKDRGQHQKTLGLYGLDGRHLRLLRLRPEKLPADQPSALRDSDVYILHQLILRQILGIDGPEMGETNLKYTRDESEAVNLVDSGEYQLAILLNPAPVSSVLAVADEGARMPQKSTYFYPKTPAGLVINPLWTKKLTSSRGRPPRAGSR